MQVLRLILARNAPKFAQDDRSIYDANFSYRRLGFRQTRLPA
jgi:hypothetical protein